jgi:hypothetical protein
VARAVVAPEVLVQLRRVHESVDASVARLEARHRDRLQCRRGCSDCCVDGLRVSIAEAARIAASHAALLEAGSPAPAGRCAMLSDDGACRVYADRPYVCRTQGLPLRWMDDAGAEHRDVCPKNAPGGPPLEELDPTACWSLGGAEAALALVDRLAGGTGERVALRDLFVRREAAPATTAVETPTRVPPKKNP